MFIDIHVHPAFYEPINEDVTVEKMRHDALDIHLNGTAPLQHIFNQMRCAGLNRLCLLPEDYTTEYGRPLVTNEEIRRLVDMAPDRFIGFAGVDPMAPGGGGGVGTRIRGSGACGAEAAPIQTAFPSVG